MSSGVGNYALNYSNNGMDANAPQCPPPPYRTMLVRIYQNGELVIEKVHYITRREGKREKMQSCRIFVNMHREYY